MKQVSSTSSGTVTFWMFELYSTNKCNIWKRNRKTWIVTLLHLLVVLWISCHISSFLVQLNKKRNSMTVINSLPVKNCRTASFCCSAEQETKQYDNLCFAIIQINYKSKVRIHVALKPRFKAVGRLGWKLNFEMNFTWKFDFSPGTKLRFILSEQKVWFSAKIDDSLNDLDYLNDIRDAQMLYRAPRASVWEIWSSRILLVWWKRICREIPIHKDGNSEVRGANRAHTRGWTCKKGN